MVHSPFCSVGLLVIWSNNSPHLQKPEVHDHVHKSHHWFVWNQSVFAHLCPQDRCAGHPRLGLQSVEMLLVDSWALDRRNWQCYLSPACPHRTVRWWLAGGRYTVVHSRPELTSRWIACMSPWGFLTNSLYTFIISSMRATCPANLIFLDIVTR